MIIWAIILTIIALSLLSCNFANITGEFLIDHALTILLVALGILYWQYIMNKRNER
ncbi:hypothetical protein J7M00_06200 [bacterium]|nr:hypothetical protein [bacterium]